MFKNTSIKSTLIYIAGALAIANLLLVIALWNAFETIDQSLNESAQQQKASDALVNTSFHIVQIQQFLTDVGATRDHGGFAEAKVHFHAAIENLDKVIQFKPNHESELVVLKRKVNAMHEAGVKMAWDYINLGTEAGNTAMKAPVTGLDDTAARLTVDLNALVELQNRELTEARHILSDNLQAFSVSSIGFSIALLLFVVSCLFMVYLKIEPPLSSLEKSLITLKQGGGDLSQRIPHAGRDEIGEIIMLFNDFISLLQSIMQQVAMEAKQLVTCSDSLNEMSLRAREDIQKLESGTDQVASTVTELSATVAEVSSNTAHAAQNAQKSSLAANNGKAVVTKTVQAIHALSNNIDRASSVIADVEQNCANVSSVLDVIQSISDQTNLLALNAAIEAARAGEQGRGFAVVADEVRKLASRTQASTHEIQSMIERLQNGSREAVKAMEDSQNQTKETVSVIENTGTLLNDISNMVEQISQMNTHISTAVKEQKSVVEHIDRNILSINEVASRSSSEAQQTAQESLNLQRIAGNLQKTILQFKL